MSEGKTEWHVEPWGSHGRLWDVVSSDGKKIVTALDKATAHRIAAVNEMEAALEGDGYDNPILTRVEWLASLLAEIEAGAWVRPFEDEDPQATSEMISVLHDMVKECRAALAKARGE